MWSKNYRFGNVTIRVDSEIEYEELDKYKKFHVETEEYHYRIFVRMGELPSVPANAKWSYDAVHWEEDGCRCQERCFRPATEIELFSYTKESEKEAYQVYTEKGASYLGTLMIFQGFDMFALLNRLGGALLHGSYVQYKGKGLIFTGASGIGKSTQAALWEEKREAQIVNGDRAFVQKCGDVFEVHGICFSGTSGICENNSSPLAAIVVLKQAVKNKVTKLGGKDSFLALLSQCSFHKENKDEVTALTKTLAELIGEVPVYLLECTPDERAIEVLEKVL